MIVYKTTNLVNGKIYIGQDVSNKLWYFGLGILLLRAIKKYGKDKFKKEILEVCNSKEELNKREIYWISALKSTDPKIGYNLSEGGTGGDLLTDNPNRDIIVEKRKGRIPWNKGLTKEKNESLKSASIKRIGQKRSKKSRLKMSKAHIGQISNMKGKKHSEETIKKMSDTKKGRVAWNKGKQLSKKHKANLSKKRKENIAKGMKYGNYSKSK